jgi:hypothetical protein
MKAINSTSIEAITKALKKSDTDFREPAFGRIVAALKSVIQDDDLTGINDILKRSNRRQLTIEDIARVAYVHLRSIKENDGYSPYNRIAQYCGAQGCAYDNIHIKAATDCLLAVEFLKLEQEEDRKKRQCRKYSVPSDVQEVTGIRMQ